MAAQTILPSKTTKISQVQAKIKKPSSNNFQKGLLGQNLVQNYLENLGFVLICANFQFYYGRKMGEIDLIMQKGQRLHLIEVKLRTNSKFGSLYEQITRTKLQSLAKAWEYFIFKNPYFRQIFCQFDAALVSQISEPASSKLSPDQNEITKNESEIEMIWNAYQFD